MPSDVVAVRLLEYPPHLEVPVDCLVVIPCVGLHPLVFRWVARIVRALDLVGGANISVVSLDPLTRLEEVTQHFVIYFNVGILTGRVRPLDPHQVPREDVHPQLVAQGGLPRVLVGREGVPLRRGSLLGDAEVRAVNRHRAVIEHVVCAQPAFEDNLRLRGVWQRGGGGEDRRLKKKEICLTINLSVIFVANYN